MGLLPLLEEHYEGTLRGYLRKALPEALQLYQPTCRLAMHRYHFCPRRLQ